MPQSEDVIGAFGKSWSFTCDIFWGSSGKNQPSFFGELRTAIAGHIECYQHKLRSLAGRRKTSGVNNSEFVASDVIVVLGNIAVKAQQDGLGIDS